MAKLQSKMDQKLTIFPICSQQRDKHNRARIFFPFKYFLNDQLLTVFMQKYAFKTRPTIAIKKWITYY